MADNTQYTNCACDHVHYATCDICDKGIPAEQAMYLCMRHMVEFEPKSIFIENPDAVRKTDLRIGFEK